MSILIGKVIKLNLKFNWNPISSPEFKSSFNWRPILLSDQKNLGHIKHWKSYSFQFWVLNVFFTKQNLISELSIDSGSVSQPFTDPGAPVTIKLSENPSYLVSNFILKHNILWISKKFGEHFKTARWALVVPGTVVGKHWITGTMKGSYYVASMASLRD